VVRPPHPLGDLDRSYLTRLRARGGLQSYPSRTKDPDQVDFSTGSVGLGASAPLLAALVRRYVDAHFGARPRSRFVALLGDAELDEGNVWEAVFDPATPAGILCSRRREALRRPPRVDSVPVAVPAATGIRGGRPLSTQATTRCSSGQRGRRDSTSSSASAR
jgi:hypothetical protein